MDNISATGTDFIATELLRCLKRENERKDNHIKRLQLTLIILSLSASLCVLVMLGAFIWYVTTGI